MLTFALALAFVCPQQLVVTAPALHTTHAALELRECGRRVAGPWPARDCAGPPTPDFSTPV